MKKLNVIYGCLVFVFLVAMCSCGARKVSKQAYKEETKSEVVDNSVIEKQTDTNVKTTTTLKVDSKNETVIKKTTYEPQDNSKESSITESDGTKTVLNNTKKTVEETIKRNNIQTQLSGNTEQVIKEAVKEQKAVKQVNTSKKGNSAKNIDRKAFNPLNLLWFIMPLLIIYVFYRIYKKLPLIPKI